MRELKGGLEGTGNSEGAWGDEVYEQLQVKRYVMMAYTLRVSRVSEPAAKDMGRRLAWVIKGQVYPYIRFKLQISIADGLVTIIPLCLFAE